VIVYEMQHTVLFTAECNNLIIEKEMASEILQPYIYTFCEVLMRPNLKFCFVFSVI
jgi:hypothetical protein